MASITEEYYENGTFIEMIKIPVPGLHNLSNITAAIAASRMIGITFEEINFLINFFKLTTLIKGVSPNKTNTFLELILFFACSIASAVPF